MILKYHNFFFKLICKVLELIGLVAFLLALIGLIAKGGNLNEHPALP
jgi:hypothetical protein